MRIDDGILTFETGRRDELDVEEDQQQRGAQGDPFENQEEPFHLLIRFGLVWRVRIWDSWGRCCDGLAGDWGTSRLRIVLWFSDGLDAGRFRFLLGDLRRRLCVCGSFLFLFVSAQSGNEIMRSARANAGKDEHIEHALTPIRCRAAQYESVQYILPSETRLLRQFPDFGSWFIRRLRIVPPPPAPIHLPERFLSFVVTHPSSKRKRKFTIYELQ